MRKKTPPPEKKQLWYEKDKMLRWNLCQSFAKALKNSKLTNAEIQAHYDSFVDTLCDSCN